MWCILLMLCIILKVKLNQMSRLSGNNIQFIVINDTNLTTAQFKLLGVPTCRHDAGSMHHASTYSMRTLCHIQVLH